MTKPGGNESRPNPGKQKISDASVKRRPPVFMISFTILLILAGGLGMAFSYASIHDTQLRTQQARNELAAQRDANDSLRTEITQRYSLDEIAKIASGRLGMNKPDASQIVYINVPKQSHVMLNDDFEDAAEKKGSFADLLKLTADRLLNTLGFGK